MLQVTAPAISQGAASALAAAKSAAELLYYADYTPESWANLQTALNLAETTLAQVQTKTTAILEAIDDLVEAVISDEPAWTNVGAASLQNITDVTQLGNLSIIPNYGADEKPYIVYKDASLKAHVLHFNGTSWSQVGLEISNIGTGSKLIMKCDVAGAPYLAYTDTNGYVKVKKLVFGEGDYYWQDVCETTTPKGSVLAMDLDIMEGIPYVAFLNSVGDGAGFYVLNANDNSILGDTSIENY